MLEKKKCQINNLSIHRKKTRKKKENDAQLRQTKEAIKDKNGN